jgi:hypothetical protein
MKLHCILMNDIHLILLLEEASSKMVEVLMMIRIVI